MNIMEDNTFVLYVVILDMIMQEKLALEMLIYLMEEN